MKLWAVSVLTVSVLLAVSSTAEKTEKPQEMNHDPSYRVATSFYAPVQRAPGYGRDSYGYRRRGGYGYGGDYYQEPYYRDGKKELDELDELYSRLDVVQTELKTVSEALGSAEARLSLEKKRLDTFQIDELPAAQKVDDNQDNALTRMMDQLDDLGSALGDLENLVTEIENTNTLVLQSQEQAQTNLAQENSLDTEQDGDIAKLQAAAKDLKGKLLQVMANDFERMDDDIETGNDFLELVKKKENARMCEVGQVTLDTDDRKAEYLFETQFAYVPQVLYAICGYDFDLDAGRDHNDDQHRDYGYRGYHKEPNALGVTVTASMVTVTGATFEAFDLSFGKSALRTVDVCFQACSIGPEENNSDLMMASTVV